MSETDTSAALMLSVSGIRGLIDRSLHDDTVARYALAFGAQLAEQPGRSAPPHIVIGRDSRPSGERFEEVAVAALCAAGFRVTRLGIVTTPGVAIMIGRAGADGGLVITASHNPGEWNGVKALRSDGAAPPADEAARIIERFRSQSRVEPDPGASAAATRDDTTADVHRDGILPHVDAQLIRDAKLRVVLDSVNGAGGPESVALLDEFGVELIHLCAEPTGRFTHPPEPVKENLTGLCDAVREHGADVGFAQDPDADRLAVVDERGVYIGEEYTLALCALHLLGAGDVAVTNLSTSRMIDDVAARAGATVRRAPVGEANVAEAIRRLDAKVGGEGNGGVIWPTVTCVRDSLVGMALLLEMLARRGHLLSRIVEGIPRYAIVKVKTDADAALIERIADLLPRRYAAEHVDTRDGVRIDFADRWIHARPSNTEPIVRLIAEAATASEAHELIDDVKGVLGLL